MKWSRQHWVWLTATVLLTVASVDAWADARTNPYDPIVERNPFGLKPPPVPDPDAGKPPPPPPPPLATVELTGIINVGPLRALLEIVPGPGKPMIKPVLSEGERVESVEVVSINIDKNQVVIKNGNVTTNLTFKVAKAGPAAAAPPGAVPPPAIPGIVPPPAQTSYNQNYGGSGRNNVMVAGGASAATPTAGAPAYGANSGVTGSGANAPTLSGGATDGGFRSIPSRKILSNSAIPQGTPQMSPEEQIVHIEINEQLNQRSGKNFPPLPPTPAGIPRRGGPTPPFPGQP